MNVYIIERDYDFQYFLPDTDDIGKLGWPNSLGQPFPQGWKVPPFFIREPRLKRGNFVHWLAWILIADKKATDTLQDMFEKSGELFKFDYKGEEFSLFNPLNTLDVLDEENTIWRRHYKTGNKTEVIEKYVFHQHRVSHEEVPIFKIPEKRSELFTIEKEGKDSENEFKYRVEKAGLTGIKFIEIWSDESNNKN
jgi:hypothetical protein